MGRATFELTPASRQLTRTGVRASVLATVLAAGLLVPSTALAQDEPDPNAVESASPPVEVDGEAEGLKLADGAVLAPAKVLDIKSVVEVEGGDERREESNTTLKFSLQAEVLFGKDSAELSAKAKGLIAEVAAEIGKQNATKVNVFGFTDNLGSYEHGKVLSKQRAMAVNRELAKILGSGVTYQVRGYSEDYPIASNATEEGRKKNRRVEVSFPRSAP
ncbi:OmpA family protein [Streptomyces polyrhachis]|uniref:OmpA family protein n=1 Tax=Streptomyces polyrhachis TaxID=1282885 RepID=A0ABW2GBL2_9ACTN